MTGISVRMIAAIVVVWSGGCDIFQTRDPEPPSQQTSSFEPPVTPEAVLRNFRAAIAENNADNYLRCFVDTLLYPYLFVPAQELRQNFAVWTLDDEVRYFRSMGARLNGRSLLSDSLQPGIFYSDSTYNLNYTLFVPHLDANVPRLVRGSMQIHLAVDRQGRWSIDQWHDYRRPNLSDSTWSYLKFWFDK